MDELMKSGPAGMLAAISVLLALNILVKVGEFLWKIKEKRDAFTEGEISHLSDAINHNTRAAENLELRMKTLESTIGDITKVKTDLRRLFSAVKVLSGDKWSSIRKDVMEEEITPS